MKTPSNRSAKSGSPPPKKFKSAEFVEDSGDSSADENVEPGSSSRARRPTTGGKGPCAKVRKENEERLRREEAEEADRLQKEAARDRLREKALKVAEYARQLRERRSSVEENDGVGNVDQNDGAGDGAENDDDTSGEEDGGAADEAERARFREWKRQEYEQEQQQRY
ncbi:hypothetical protein AAVH_25774, partial [Aphelenchoides avenae]